MDLITPLVAGNVGTESSLGDIETFGERVVTLQERSCMAHVKVVVIKASVLSAVKEVVVEAVAKESLAILSELITQRRGVTSRQKSEGRSEPVTSLRVDAQS